MSDVDREPFLLNGKYIKVSDYKELKAENARLKKILKVSGETINRIAFEIPPVNSYTPQLVLLATSMMLEVNRVPEPIEGE